MFQDPVGCGPSAGTVNRAREADLLALSRPLIKEPALIRDWQKGDLRRATCISCNKCFEALLKGEALRCVYQEETGR